MKVWAALLTTTIALWASPGPLFTFSSVHTWSLALYFFLAKRIVLWPFSFPSRGLCLTSIVLPRLDVPLSFDFAFAFLALHWVPGLSAVVLCALGVGDLARSLWRFSFP